MRQWHSDAGSSPVKARVPADAGVANNGRADKLNKFSHRFIKKVNRDMRPLLFNVSFLAIFMGHIGIAAAGDLPLSSKQNNVETFQLDCPENPKITTIDMNNCLTEKIDQIKAIQARYEAAARNRVAEGLNDPGSHDHVQETLEAFDAESKAWEALRAKATYATYTDWEEGTIRNAMSAQRDIEIRELRIHDLWLNWLQYMDSTPSVLPEPKFIDVQ